MDWLVSGDTVTSGGIRTEQRRGVPHDGVEDGQRRFLVRGPQEDVVEGVALDLAAVEVAHRAGQLDGAGDLAAEARQRGAADPVGDVGVVGVPERQPTDARRRRSPAAPRGSGWRCRPRCPDAARVRGCASALRQAGRLEEPDAGLDWAPDVRSSASSALSTIAGHGRVALDGGRDRVRRGEVAVLAEHLAVGAVDEPEHQQRRRRRCRPRRRPGRRACQTSKTPGDHTPRCSSCQRTTSSPMANPTGTRMPIAHSRRSTNRRRGAGPDDRPLVCR